ncbi:unnamed protein product [Symbiodinium necroappetens]|uniref:Uncharacterized protein n=1 Tax=Symbiodinium necroappetens TaxID=1628268 RepID=A0A812XX87_9DINO|nr:unnamed protein product [Symbiodinium necroappetens]
MARADEDPEMQELRRMTARQAAKAVKLEDEAIDAQLGVNHEEQVRAGEEAAEEVERTAPKKRLRKPVPSSQDDYEAARNVGRRRVRSLAESETFCTPARPPAPTVARDNAGHRVGGVRLDKIMDEIRKLQGAEAPEHLVPRVAFARLVQDTMTKLLKQRYADRAPEMRMTSEATAVLQDTAEWKCTDVLSAANKAASHTQGG